MFNLEKEIDEWKQLLDAGEIDQTTYNEEINRLMKKKEKIKQVNNLKKEMKEINYIDLTKKVLIGISIFLILGIILLFFSINIMSKKYEYVPNLSNLPEPRQVATTGGTTKNVFGENVKIDYVASYSISGRVVNVHNFLPYKTENILSPVDLGISWGIVASDQYNKKLSWGSRGRFLLCSGGEKETDHYFSNNHLIASNSQIERIIKNIKEGDFVKIEGYLANVNFKNMIWTTSTNRIDDGAGACEVIYVTDVTWLKEE